MKMSKGRGHRGNACGNIGKPGAYAKTSSVWPWIQDTMGAKGKIKIYIYA